MNKEFPSIIIIKITEEDIKQGIKGDCENCPMARAVSRRFPEYHIDVSGISVFIRDNLSGKTITQYKLSHPAARYIRNFDFGIDTRPATFRLTRKAYYDK